MQFRSRCPGGRHKLPPDVVYPAALPPTSGSTAFRQDHLPGHS
ncbi:hypothetical protein NKCBBBOE_00708 [Pseudarthrobacter sp. MM222]|nr:hypothetical protein NKCBBBOE_00708 [Pseudarthrobacter sp. MM222]